MITSHLLREISFATLIKRGQCLLLYCVMSLSAHPGNIAINKKEFLSNNFKGSLWCTVPWPTRTAHARPLNSLENCMYNLDGKHPVGIRTHALGLHLSMDNRPTLYALRFDNLSITKLLKNLAVTDPGWRSSLPPPPPPLFMPNILKRHLNWLKFTQKMLGESPQTPPPFFRSWIRNCSAIDQHVFPPLCNTNNCAFLDVFNF